MITIIVLIKHTKHIAIQVSKHLIKVIPAIQLPRSYFSRVQAKALTNDLDSL